MGRKKVLELFSGSRSIGKIADLMGHEVFSVDITDFPNTDLVKDILDVVPGDIPWVPDMIWASPPCTFFSVASIGYHWNKDNTPKTENAVLGVKIVDHTIELIRFFERANPNMIWYMENPRGKLRKLPVVSSLHRTTVWYCKYGDKRAKPTDIWSNNIFDPTLFGNGKWVPRKECKNGNKDCHHESAPRGSQTGTQGVKGNYLRSQVPEELCTEILLTLNRQ